MSGGLGPLLGEGRTAEVFGYGEGRVIKLLRPGFREQSLREEAIKTAAAAAAGAPAPGVYGIEHVEERPGIVFDRAEGMMLLDLIMEAPHRARHWGRALAGIHAEVMGSRSDQLPDVREVLAAKISAAEALSAQERARAASALTQLPEGDRVLHGDFHPLNVYLGEKATVIDWLDASRGAAEADLARSFWLTSPNVIPPDFPRRRVAGWLARILGSAYRASILRLMGTSDVDVELWRMPVLAGRLSEGIAHEEPLLVRAVRALI